MRGAYKENMTCRLCNTEIETQEHILSECTKLHQGNNQLRTNTDEIYTEDLDTLKRTANKIIQIMEEVKKTKPRKGKKRKATDMPAKRPNKRTKVEQETEGNRKRKAKDQPNRRPKKKRKIETTISIESKKRKATKQPTTRPKKIRKIEKQETTVDNELRSTSSKL